MKRNWNSGAGVIAGRRRALSWLAGLLVAPKAMAQVTPDQSRPSSLASSVTQYAPVVPGYAIRFPRDGGAHPEFRVEWWYVTGWLDHDQRRPLGFQITFFRARPELRHDNPSAFTPRQIVIGHAALSDPRQGRLIHAQRAARAGFDLAGARTEHTRVWLDEWSLEEAVGVYRARIPAPGFHFDLGFAPTQPPLLQGERGFSRKGPAPESASYYYSVPHLAVAGRLAQGGMAEDVKGTAWLDHEWSSSYMPREAVGWDWIGINLDDGGALMAFRMRGSGGASSWAGGTHRRPDGSITVFAPDHVRFTARRTWRSTRTGTNYPVSFVVRAGHLELAIEPLMDDQEHDARATTGAIYWEGAVRALRDGKPVGRGYLELTGYWRRIEL